MALAQERVVPVLPALQPLVGPGLRRGATLAVVGSTSLVLALLAGASLAGSWVGVVGLPTLGLVAAAEMGVALDRLALVPHPGREWPTVTAALVDALDIVVVRPPPHARSGDARRLAARARERGAVLVIAAGGWPGPDIQLTVTAGEWAGLDSGAGHLRARRVAVQATGRRDAARPRHAWLWLPGPDGTVTTALPPGAAASRLVCSNQHIVATTAQETTHVAVAPTRSTAAHPVLGRGSSPPARARARAPA